MRQRYMELIGAEGCYFLSLVAAAEQITGKRIDAVQVYEVCLSRGWMDKDCYLVMPHAVLEYMTGQKWAVSKESSTYSPRKGEVMIMRYERQSINKTWAHFVLCYDNGQISYDPYGDSKTVRDGRPVSSRIFRRLP